MAIIPESQYPGKIAPADAEYPYGKARNITLAGDGTGTPWEAALVNDLFGFQQALLSEADITPTGNPEKVGASQYLQGLKRVLASSVESFDDLTALANPQSGEEISVKGVPFVYDGAEWKPSAGFVTPEAYGAVGDGVADDTAALVAAWENKNVLYGPKKTYLFSGNQTIAHDASWVGNGSTLKSSDGGVIFQGTSGAYEVLTSAISEGSDGFTLSESTQEGDLIKVYIDLNNSWLDNEPQSRLGDIYEVESDGVIKGGFEFDFPATDSKIKKITPITVLLHEIHVDMSGANTALILRNTKGSVVESCRAKNASSGRAIHIQESFQVMLVNCSGRCNGAIAGTEYGLSLDETKHTYVNGGKYHGTRHGVATGSSSTGIVNHAIVENAIISNDPDAVGGADLFSADMHGTTNDMTYRKNVIFSGVALSGQNPKVYDNTIFAIPGSTYSPVRYVDLRGGDVVCKDNTIKMKESSAAFALRWQATSRMLYVRENTTFDTTGNTVEVGGVSTIGVFFMPTNGDNAYGVEFFYDFSRTTIKGDASNLTSIVSQTEAGTVGTDYEVRSLTIEGTKLPDSFPATASIFYSANSVPMGQAQIKISPVSINQVFGVNAGGFGKETTGTLPYGLCNRFSKVQCHAYIENNTYNGDAFMFAYADLTSITDAFLVLTTGDKTNTLGADDTVTAHYSFYMDRKGL